MSAATPFDLAFGGSSHDESMRDPRDTYDYEGGLSMPLNEEDFAMANMLM